MTAANTEKGRQLMSVDEREELAALFDFARTLGVTEMTQEQFDRWGELARKEMEDEAANGRISREET